MVDQKKVLQQYKFMKLCKRIFPFETFSSKTMYITYSQMVQEKQGCIYVFISSYLQKEGPQMIKQMGKMLKGIFRC